ncbi:FAD-dependent oxidoreductase [Nocardia sp. NPDC050406]|uniref:FAD-dependent oxidoreductase n=1 Tax=Nocardia sp. NPDC050406 TaxID=3364318 RepID=UPI00379A4F42
MRVVIVGGGIGGLALGAGLRRRGFDVAVHDRDTDLTATGGYHITLDARAQSALATLVDPHTMRRLRASASALHLRDRDAWWDRHGRLLAHGPDLAASQSLDIDRITLRTLLAEAVGPDLHLGRTVTGVGECGTAHASENDYRVRASGSGADGVLGSAGGGRVCGVVHENGCVPTVLFADGSAVSADLVVGADGTHSVVARHLAGGPTSRSAGIIGFSGRTARAELRGAEQERLGLRSGLAVGAHGAALYIGFLDPVGNAALDAPELRMSVTTGPTYIWGAMFPESAATLALRELRGAELLDALLMRFRELGWAERTLEVMARADPSTVAAYRFNAASTRAAELAPWPATRITALGDAVHATPPTAGMGAGAAIRDAASLVDHLVAAASGTTTVPDAVHLFEAGMRERGSEVLTLAMRTVRLILATDTPLGAAATTLATPILAAAARLRR